MRLIDLLETRYQLAIKTAMLRDYRELVWSIEKLAADEKLGGLGGKLLEIAKKPFMRSPAENVLHNTSSAMFTALNQLTTEALSHMKTNVLAKNFAMSDSGQKLLDQMGKLKAMAEKSQTTKWPLKATLGFVGGLGAVSAGMAMVDKHMVDAVHRDNLTQIQGDKNIPQNLRDRAREMYGVLVTYAPTIAKDPVFSKDFTKNLIRHDTVDHKVVADLISAEKAYKESKGRKAEFLAAIGDMALKTSGWM